MAYAISFSTSYKPCFLRLRRPMCRKAVPFRAGPNLILRLRRRDGGIAVAAHRGGAAARSAPRKLVWKLKAYARASAFAPR